jgi:hypothetical protein
MNPELQNLIVMLGSLASLVVAPLAIYLLHEIKAARHELGERIENGEAATHARISATEGRILEHENAIRRDYVQRRDLDIRLENTVLKTQGMIQDLRIDVLRREHDAHHP